MSKQAPVVGFIGGGNMAAALLKGLLEPGDDGGGVSPESIVVCEPLAARRRVLKRRFGVRVTADLAQLAEAAQTVVLAVKPQVMDEVLSGLSPLLGRGKLVISIAAGVRLSRMEKALGPGVRTIRVMPNTPCLLGSGMSVLCAGATARRKDLAVARAMFEAVGEVLVVEEEKLMDAVTGLSGSGPAYVYLFAEALARGGKAAGLDQETALHLACHTLAGAARMLLESGQGPVELRKAVSSPGGTTLAGLAALASGGFSQTVASAVKAATRRSRELAVDTTGRRS